MQSGAIYGDKAWGVGLEEKFLPEYLREYGYKNHAIGKVSSMVMLCLFLKVDFLFADLANIYLFKVNNRNRKKI